MQTLQRRFGWASFGIACGTALLSAGCGGGGSDAGDSPSDGNDESPAPTAFSLSGTLTGLSGGTLVLQVNGGADINLSANGSATLAAALANGSTYTVTVRVQPQMPPQSCTVANGTGTIPGANVSTVQISCVTLPMTVVAVDPVNGARDVSRLISPSIDFSAALNATAPGFGISLVEMSGAPVAGAASVSASRASFTPQGTLWPLTEYELIADGVAGVFGEALASPARTRFTTRDGEWIFYAPALREVADLTFESLQLALNGDGVGVAAWIGRELTAIDDQVLVSTRSSGGAWSQPIPIAEHSFIESLEVAVDDDGTAHVVWAGSYPGGQTRLFVSRSETGSGQWSTPHQLSLDDDFTNNEAGIALGSAGVFVVWKSGDGVPYSIVMARFAGDAWTSPTVVSEGSEQAILPQVAADEAGGALFVWAEQSGNTYELKSRLFQDDGTSAGWAHGEIPVSTQGRGYTSSALFRLVMNDDGLGALIWPGESGGAAGPGVLAALYTVSVVPLGQGMGWGSATDLEGGQAQDGAMADIAVDAHGDVLAVWTGAYGGAENQILSRRLSRSAIARSGSFSAWNELELLGEGVAPRVALDARGNGTVLWFPRIADEGIRTRRFTGRNAWSESQMLRTTPASIFLGSCEVAFDGHGNAMAVWLEAEFPGGQPTLSGLAWARFE